MFTWPLSSAQGSLRCPGRRLIHRKKINFPDVLCSLRSRDISPCTYKRQSELVFLCILQVNLHFTRILHRWDMTCPTPPTLPSLTKGWCHLYLMPLTWHGSHKAFKVYNTDQMQCTRPLLPLNCLIYFPFVSPVVAVCHISLCSRCRIPDMSCLSLENSANGAGEQAFNFSISKQN